MIFSTGQKRENRNFPRDTYSKTRLHNPALCMCLVFPLRRCVVNRESVTIRALRLTVLSSGLLPYISSDTSGIVTADANIMVTIPKGGLPEDVEEVFFLQPSQILHVIDETGKAVYMPQAITDSVDASQGTRTDADVASSESYSAAYAFVNGKCDFTTEIQYKGAFPDYTAPLWVRTVYTIPKTEAAPSETAANFTLTNPPAEYLNESVSF
ncbi:Toxoplasma gondii family A protein [Toxoplasma gondii VAND]|nr:Toxoplasma gondii family A protein [Toxoplasma gondii VAND]